MKKMRTITDKIPNISVIVSLTFSIRILKIKSCPNRNFLHHAIMIHHSVRIAFVSIKVLLAFKGSRRYRHV